LLILGSCAIIKSPAGGPEDKTPPAVLNEEPTNESINFKSSKIIIEFDEFFKLKDKSNEIIISPSMDETPEFVVKGKKLIINLTDSLKEETTYNIQFGQSIIDITEFNPFTDYQYVFSTGDFLDSLEIQGSIIDAIEKEAVENVKIFLYESPCDSCIYKEKPKYFTRSNKDGFYKLKYLAPENYYIFALEDENNNFKYDAGEKVGFIDSVINLQSNVFLSEISLFVEDKHGLKVYDHGTTEQNRFYIVLDKNYESLKLYSTESNEEVKYISDRDNDSLIFWELSTRKPSFTLVLNDTISDTLSFDNDKKIITKIKEDLDLYRKQRFYINANKPILSLDNSKITFLEDSVSREKYTLTYTDSNNTKLMFDYRYRYKRLYNLSFKDSCIMFYDSTFSKQKDITFNYNKEELLSALSLSLINENKENVIVELMSREDVLRTYETNKSENLVFKDLVPGKYRVRFIIDENLNEKWDTGDLQRKKQPEKIFYMKKEIELKANWQLEERFSIPQF
jgi:hypothetical protein